MGHQGVLSPGCSVICRMTTMTKAESRTQTADEESQEMAFGRRTENLVSGNDRAVAVGVVSGNVDAGAD